MKRYLLLICILLFTLHASAQEVRAAREKEIFAIVEEMPEFPGGNEALYQFLVENLKYPKKARKKDIEGTVYIQFVVSETGKVEEIEVVRSAHPLLNEEAMRVAALMPDWKPGIQKGKAVKVYFTFPVRFSLK